MGRLRFLPLVALAACADVSGLNDLVVDGAANQDAAAQDAGDVVTGGEASAGDGPPAVDAGAAFCVTQSQSRWCADFDEGDVTMGYANGLKAPWTGWSQVKPTLSTHNASPPASAGFDGALDQSLNFTASPITTTYELIAQLRVETMTDNNTSVATVQVTPSYGLKVAVARVGNSLLGVTINEAWIGDAGSTITAHPINGSFALGSWILIDMTVTAQQVTVSLSSSLPQAFSRAITGGSQSVSTSLYFDTANWTGQWDSVRIAM